MEEDDASRLQLGQEFDQATALTIAEVGYILTQTRSLREKQQFGEVYDKTLKYTQDFAKMSSKQAIAGTREVLDKYGLHTFEAAQLSNLCPAESDEAHHLIPSLADRADVQDILDELEKVRTGA